MTAVPIGGPTVQSSVPRFRVLDIGISALTFEQAIDTVLGWIARRERHWVNVCTVHTVLECHDSPAMREIVNRSGLATPDGMPLVWLGRLSGRRVERVYGPDLMLALCDHGRAVGVRHFLYGGAKGVPEQLAARLTARFPALQIVGTYSPPFRALSLEEQQQTVTMINGAKADIVWVGLGTPKQDYWVARNRAHLEAPVLIAVGAAFDFHSGRVRQAPDWMQRSGLEWLYRLTQDPRRLWKRYVIGNPKFVYLVARDLLGGRR